MFYQTLFLNKIIKCQRQERSETPPINTRGGDGCFKQIKLTSEVKLLSTIVKLFFLKPVMLFMSMMLELMSPILVLMPAIVVLRSKMPELILSMLFLMSSMEVPSLPEIS